MSFITNDHVRPFSVGSSVHYTLGSYFDVRNPDTDLLIHIMILNDQVDVDVSIRSYKIFRINVQRLFDLLCVVIVVKR